MFLKYSLIGLGSAGVVGVGGYAVYHEVSNSKKNRAAKEQYGSNITLQNNIAVTQPTVDPSVQDQEQQKTISKPK